MNKNAERRSSLRRPIHHEAKLNIDKNEQWPCIIADYCNEGMFIKFASIEASSIESALNYYGGSPLTITFIGHENKRFELEFSLVHMMSGAIGIRFVEDYSLAIRSLDEQRSASHRQVIPEPSVKVIISNCIDYIQNYTQPLISGLWPVIIGNMKAASVKAARDQLANEMMAASERLDKKQASIQSAFSIAIQDPIGAYQQGIASENEMNDRLSLIDKGEFEDWLLSRVIITKAETNYRNLLLPLKVRLDSIGIGDRKYHQSAFGPALLVSAFQSAILPLSLGSQSEKIVFQALDHELISKLEGLYVGLNDILIKHKVLPELNLSKALKASSPNKVASKKPAMDKSGGTEKPDSPEKQGVNKEKGEPAQNEVGGPVSGQLRESGQQPIRQSTVSTAPPFSNPDTPFGLKEPSFQQNQEQAKSALNNVVGLMRSLRGLDQPSSSAQSSASGGGSDSVAPSDQENESYRYSENELVAGLSELQAASATQDANVDEPISLMSRVKENLQQGGGSEKEIDENQKVAIDVVDRFFFSMRNNPRLSSEAKQHLLKLEVPVLKVLLKDDRFFEDHSSSVRAVMNRIAQLGAKGARLNPASSRKVTGLVHKIVDEFEHDTQVFDHVLSELDQLIERQNQLYVKNVERVAAAADGVHRVEDAKIAVAQAINDRLGDKNVPAAVLTLLENGWKDLLNLTHIQQGEDSESWHRYLSVIERLVAFGDDPRIPLDMKTILPQIQTGLKLVSGNSVLVREALKGLIQKANSHQHDMVRAQLQDVPETEDDIVRRNIHKSHELKTWILRVKSIEVGTWIQLVKDGDEVQYMRLVWIAKGYSKFVFVNHQGMKVIELGLFKFATYLKEKRILLELDYEVPMVNQGLDDMVKDVYDKLAYESSHDEGSGLIKKSEFCRQVRSMMKMGRRTSACSLTYIRFHSESAQGFTCLDTEFAKQVAETLLGLNDTQSISGRINENDFVYFAVSDDLDLLQVCCQESLSLLCQQADFSDLCLKVVVGESRAHLGFLNPESMIRHALKPLERANENQVDESSVNDGGSKERVGNDTPSSGEKTDDNVDISLDKLPENEEPEKLFIHEAANTVPDSTDLDNLVFDIFAQQTQHLVDSANELEKDEATAIETKEETYSYHVNLQCFLEGVDSVYEPEEEESARHLDEWWLQKLIQLHAEHHPIWDGIAYLRVKLSGFAFQDQTFSTRLMALSESSGLDASKVCFDLYDCSVIEDIHEAAVTMRALNKQGFRFCLDHFGSERSPFAFLKVLPVEMIKIDEGFMETLNQDDGDVQATDSIVEIAHYLGKKVLATSVESAICLQKMKHLKVDYVQGSTISEMVKI